MDHFAGHFAAYSLLQELPKHPFLASFVAAPQDQPHRKRILHIFQGQDLPPVEAQLVFAEASRAEARTRVDGLVPVAEIGEWMGYPFIAYEYCFSISLETLVAHRQRHPDALPPAAAATLVYQAAHILANAHRAGLTHGALSAQHVLIEPSGDVSLTAFAEGHVRARFQVLNVAQPKDDPPELRRRDQSGPAADFYAIGALLFRALTGRDQPDEWEPRWSNSMMELSMAGVPGEALKRTIDFLHRTLAERAAQRFQSFGALMRDFEALLVDVDAPKPREAIGLLIRDLFPAPPRTSPISSPDLSFQAPRLSSAIDIPRPPQTTPVLLEEGNDAVAGDDDEHPNRETRLLHKSQPSLRALSPELRQRIEPHELEILARTRYQVLEEIGAGGTGTVYKVLDTTLSEVLALKVLRPDLTRDAGWLQRFKRELRITRDLEHKFILPAYHLESIDGLYFFSMRYVDGITLYEHLRQHGPLDLHRGCEVLIGVGQALAAAHDSGIVHRDFKSANIMLEKGSGHPYLMDFGIALAPDSPGLTMTGQGIGTPYYMAPEQARGEPIGPRADLYAFGVVLYESFTAILPFHGTTTVAVYTAQIQGKYRPLQEVAPHLPQPLIDLVDQCLRADPDLRPANMREILDLLAKVA